MVTIKSTHVAAPPPSQGDAPLIEQQITEAIASGFGVLIKDIRAMHREMAATQRDMIRSAEAVAKRMEGASRVAPTGGLRAAAPMVGAEAAHEAVRAHATASAGRHTTTRAESWAGQDVYENARSVEKLRSNVGGRIASTAQNMLVRPGSELYQDPNGDWFQQSDRVFFDPPSGSWKRADGSKATAAEVNALKVNKKSGFHQNAAGQWINSATNRYAKAADVAAAAEEGGDRIAKFQNRLRIASTVSKAAEAFGEGAPVGRALMSMLPTGAIKAAGYAGLAYQAVNKGMAFAQGQYAKNRRYQEYLGGSNFDGFGQRLAAFGNSFRGKFTLLGEDNYNQLFEQSTRMGERGGRREESITEGARIMGTGAGIGQTMDTIKIARETGQSLTGLASAIAGVNKVARDASVSAVAARDVFIENYRVISSMQALTGNANGAKTSAAAIASSQASLGPAYAGGTDYSGSYSNQMQYFLAARSGMSIQQFTLAQGNNPGLYQATLGATVQKALDQWTPQGKRSIRDIVTSYVAGKGGNFVASIDVPKLTAELLKEGYNPMLIQQQLAQYGIQASTQKDAMAQAIQMFTNQSVGAKSIQAQQDQVEKFSMPAKGDLKGGENFYALASQNPGSGSLQSQELYKAYIGADLQKGKQRYPVVEELLKRVREGKLSSNAQVMVKTASGNRVVKLKDAIKDFSDQLQNGTANIIDDNQGLNSSVSDYVGLPSGLTDNAGPAASESATTKAGKTEEQWRKEQTSKQEKDAKKSGNTKVTIDLTDDVKRYFKVISTSGTDTSLGTSSWDGTSGNLPGVKP